MSTISKARNARSSQPDMSWRLSGSCRGNEVIDFFPTPNANAKIQAARLLCYTCTVQAECLEYSIITNQEAGIWGGATEEERRILRRIWIRNNRRVG